MQDINIAFEIILKITNIFLILISYILFFKKNSKFKFWKLLPGFSTREFLDLININNKLIYLYISLEYIYISLIIKIFLTEIYVLYFNDENSEIINQLLNNVFMLLICSMLFIPLYIYIMNKLRLVMKKNKKIMSKKKFIVVLFMSLYLYNAPFIYYNLNKKYKLDN